MSVTGVNPNSSGVTFSSVVTTQNTTKTQSIAKRAFISLRSFFESFAHSVRSLVHRMVELLSSRTAKKETPVVVSHEPEEGAQVEHKEAEKTVASVVEPKAGSTSYKKVVAYTFVAALFAAVLGHAAYRKGDVAAIRKDYADLAANAQKYATQARDTVVKHGTKAYQKGSQLASDAKTYVTNGYHTAYAKASKMAAQSNQKVREGYNYLKTSVESGYKSASNASYDACNYVAPSICPKAPPKGWFS